MVPVGTRALFAYGVASARSRPATTNSVTLVIVRDLDNDHGQDGHGDLLREVASITRDDVSGATDLTLRAADLLLRALAAGGADSVVEALLRAKPMMASLLNLACLGRGEPVAATAYVRGFRDGLAAAPSRAAREAVRFLEQSGTGPWTVLTLSASRVVEQTLLALAGRGAVTALVVAESRPRLEGEALAARLARRVPHVAVTHDAALPGLCTPESLVLLGADAVLPDAFVNKAGSLALCLAAREAHSRRLVVTTSHKVLRPEALPHFRLPEVVLCPETAPGNVTHLDIQFERVPLGLVEAVVTEDGPRT